jgi:hypothetical protein
MQARTFCHPSGRRMWRSSQRNIFHALNAELTGIRCRFLRISCAPLFP